MADDITLLYHEILDKVHKAKTKKEKVQLLKKYNTAGLKMVIKSSFDPKIEWAIPEGDVPFEVNDAPDGTEQMFDFDNMVMKYLNVRVDLLTRTTPF